jgi:hypothetical protein
VRQVAAVYMTMARELQCEVAERMASCFIVVASCRCLAPYPDVVLGTG